MSAARTYVSLARIAAGGMGTVDLAIRADTASKPLAIKRLHAHLRTFAPYTDMLVDEGRLAGLVDHPNVVPVRDVGADADGGYLVMDYIDGLPLSSILGAHRDRRESMPVQLCARIAIQIAEGLHAIHELRGPSGAPLDVVHRDLSPSNILVGYDAVVRISDFGVALAHGRLVKTTDGVVKGKLGYMSPEQLRRQPLDRRSDLFSFGVTLFEMLCGERLYAGEAHLVVQRILNEPAPDIYDVRSDVPASLVKLLFQLLAKEPTGRPATAALVAQSLAEVLTECEQSEGPLELSEYLQLSFGSTIAEQKATVSDLVRNRVPVMLAMDADLAPIQEVTIATESPELLSEETSAPELHLEVEVARSEHLPVRATSLEFLPMQARAPELLAEHTTTPSLRAAHASNVEFLPVHVSSSRPPPARLTSSQFQPAFVSPPGIEGARARSCSRGFLLCVLLVGVAAAAVTGWLLLYPRDDGASFDRRVVSSSEGAK